MKKINETFVCLECGNQVGLAPKTCRNHCPRCFTSLHVDWQIPWDRSSSCHGKMYPKEYFISNWEIKILFQCVKCWKTHCNKTSADDNLPSLDELIYKYKKFF